MKISYNWLKRYLDIDLPVDEVAAILTGSGLEVEGIEPFETIKGSLEGVVTGKVLTCTKHPNADKLSLTTVDIGGPIPLNIVCGAPNVAEGQCVLVATVGTTIYKGETSFVISEAKIRGELSRGMICAEDELGLGTSHEGIMVLPENTSVGIPALQYFGVYQDTILEIGLTPNRSDAYSHIGVVRDLLAVLRTSQPEKYGNHRLNWPSVEAFRVEGSGDLIPVTIEDAAACPRYCGLTLTGIQLGQSPEWMQNLLKAGGMRPINVIVDITNFVLLETGQPLHAFDADKIEGQQVIVKKLPEGTPFTTLDGIDRKLSAQDLMICSATRGMCMAGVYGGLDSGVTETTTRVFLESAYFNPVTIRKTARYHGLNTDSSQRFERGANPDMTIYAMKRAALLMKEYAGAIVASEIQDVYPKIMAPKEIKLRFDKMDTLIGKSIPRDTIKNILECLEISILEESEEGLLLSVPPFKTDVEREADIVEEVLRIYGYNNIALGNEIWYTMGEVRQDKQEKLKDLISEHLTAWGFSEIWCNSLTRSEYANLTTSFPPETYVRLLNPLSRDLEVMRRTLIFGGLETIVHNQNRKISDLKLFEFGSVYSRDPGNPDAHSLARYHENQHFGLWITGRKLPETWYEKKDLVDIYYLKALINSMLRKTGIGNNQYQVRRGDGEIFSEGLQYVSIVDGTTLLEFGELLPRLLKAFDIRQAVFYACIHWETFLKLLAGQKVIYKELPRFPWARRDLALLIDEKVSFEEIRKIGFAIDNQLLRHINLFDVYEGEGVEKGKKSYAVSFILQDDQKTLTDEVIDGIMEKLIRQYRDQLGAVIR